MEVCNLSNFYDMYKKELFVKCLTADGVVTQPADLKPYFFIRKKDSQIIRDIPYVFANVEHETGDFISTRKDELLKLSFHSPQQLKTIKEKLDEKNIPTFEADVPYNDRWMIDKKVQPPMLKPEMLLSFDIETDARSVDKNTLIDIRRGSKVFRIRVEDLYCTFSHDMETISLQDSSIKWSKILKVHKHLPGKKMFKVTTSTGKSVYVTEDHSMEIYHAGVIVEAKPTELEAGKTLIPIVPIEIYARTAFPRSRRSTNTQNYSRQIHYKFKRYSAEKTSNAENVPTMQQTICNNLQISQSGVLQYKLRTEISQKVEDFKRSRIHDKMRTLQNELYDDSQLQNTAWQTSKPETLLQQIMCNCCTRPESRQANIVAERTYSRRMEYKSKLISVQETASRNHEETLVRSIACKENVRRVESTTKFSRTEAISATQRFNIRRKWRLNNRAKTSRLRNKKSTENSRTVWRTLAPRVRNRTSCGSVQISRLHYSNNMGSRRISQRKRSEVDARRLLTKYFELEYVTNVEYVGIAKDYVYDLEVADAHNFAANGIIVHNSGFPRANNPFQRVISIGCVDGTGKEWFICNDDEIAMYREFSDIAQKYPILTGWNIDKFDVPYLEARGAYIGLNKFNVGLSSYVDGMVLYQMAGYARSQSLRLDDVIHRELGKEIKKEFETLNKMQNMWASFIGDRKKLEDYCMDDTRSVAQLMLSPKHQIIEMNVMKARIAHARYSHLSKISKLVEGLRLGIELDRHPRNVFSTRPWMEEKPELGGGYVFEPLVGRHSWVAVLDFSGMYSRIMRMFNVDLESLSTSTSDRIDPNTYRSPNGVHFSRHPDSGNRILLTELEVGKLRERQLQNAFPTNSTDWMLHYILSAAYKVFGLSFYGVLGSEYSRFFDIDVANAITAWGREFIQCIAQFARNRGFRVIYGDTDSVFIAMKTQSSEAAQQEMRLLADLLNQDLKAYVIKTYGIAPEDYIMELEAEKLFDRFYIPAKKSYIGRYAFPVRDAGKLFSRGMDLIKYGVFPLLRETQIKLFNTLFNTDDMSAALKTISSDYQKTRIELFSGRLDEKLVMKRGVRKPLDSYQVSTPHAQAAKLLADVGMFREGDIVNYVVTQIQKGNQITMPIVDAIPRIEASGYAYYYSRLTEMRDKVLGTATKTNLLELI